MGKFISLLEERGLHDPCGTYKAIGFIKKADSAGITIGSYWNGFDTIKQQQPEYKYWSVIDEICSQLQQGKLYRAEPLVRKLMCRLFHYAGVIDTKTGKEHTPSSLRTTLKDEQSDIYSGYILNLAQLTNYTRKSVDGIVRSIISALLNLKVQEVASLFRSIPAYFMEKPLTHHKCRVGKNVVIEPLRGRRIQFDTVHGVKGETHDATLYLETELQKGSDIGRMLYCYGIGQAGSSPLYDYSRKIVYVGMSRPRKLLCMAIQDSTYRKSKDAFREWHKIDLRKSEDE